MGGYTAVMNVIDSILLEDDGLIVVDKPAGIPTAGDSLEQPGSLQYELMQHYRRMIWAVHQLDRDTSGVNLFVRRKSLVQTWTEHLRAGTKSYVALLTGRFGGGLIDAPVGWVGQGVRGVTDGGKSARTEFIVEAATEEATLVRALLHTGRTHQIRIHAAHVGHPIIGDARYGSPSALIARQALHASEVVAHERVFTAALPADMKALLEHLQLDHERS